ncbi:MAG: acyltransferase family protein [Acidimicrobiales bacterium]|nr:acyltransferase family protein [Acidimicrobiales bacterium]
MSERLASVRPVTDPDAERAAHRYRGDVEGLRAVAVAAVIAYHAGIAGVSGGFAGVDVFFVISGYLITRLLIDERDRTGRTRMASFYARRARRLLPAATAVLVATFVAAAVWQGPLEQRESIGDGRAAALFVANVRFAVTATDYLGEATAPSVFQQYWSLSLEEQWYLLWPALVVLAAVAARRLRRGSATGADPADPGDGTRRRAVTGLVVGAVVAGSFVWSWHQSSTDAIGAFFGLPARAWELGIGALVALAAAPMARLADRSAAARAIAGAGGLVAILAACVWFTRTTPWPGWAAALPVLGTAAVLAAGCGSGRHPAGRLLGAAPLQWIGRRSYSLYLWHWPPLVLAADLTATRTGLAAYLVGVVIVAAVSYRVVEQPARTSPALAEQPRRSLALGAGLVAVGVAASFVFAAVVDRPLDAGVAWTGPAHAPGATIVATDVVPTNLTPPLVDAGADKDPSAEGRATCATRGTCGAGASDAPTEVMLLGDSHAGHWMPALAALAEPSGWHVDRVTRGACSPFVPPAAADLDECASFLDGAWADLAAAPPDVLVLSGRHRTRFGRDPDGWADDVRAALALVPDGVRVVVVGETPETDEPVPSCLASHLDDTTACEPAWPDAEVVRINDELRAIAEEAGATYADPIPLVCSDDRCPAIAGDQLVYRDRSHLTASFVASRAPEVAAWIDAALAGRR